MAAKVLTTRKSSPPASAAKAVTVAGKTSAKKPKAATASPSAAKPVAKVPAAKSPAKKQKPAGKKQKTIRDSFNMPADDYALIGAMKERAIASGREIKKSELLRAGLKALAAMNEASFAKVIGAVPAIKTGRPTKKKK